MKQLISIYHKTKALFLAFVISRFCCWINDRTAYLKSLVNKNPISRKYDCWYYRKGKLISRYELVIQNGL